MTIQQETKTTIIADEGKVFRKKSDGMIYGDKIFLGYNYYEAGMLLSEPKLDTPDDFEEIDMPENLHTFKIDQTARMKKMLNLIEQEKKEFANRALTAEQMLEVKSLAPVWGKDIIQGDLVVKGTKFLYTPEGEAEPRLYSVLQDHTVMNHYYPSIDTAALYVEVTPDFIEVEDEIVELGTLENPIEYNGNMILENGKYYIQDGVVYLCNRDTINPVYHNLSDLIGLYVEYVEIV